MRVQITSWSERLFRDFIIHTVVVVVAPWGAPQARRASRFALRVASLSRSDARRASKSRRGIVADRPARRGRVGGAVDGAAGGGGVGTRGDRGAGGFRVARRRRRPRRRGRRVLRDTRRARGVVRRRRRLARGARPETTDDPPTHRVVVSLLSSPRDEHFAHLPRRLTLPTRAEPSPRALARLSTSNSTPTQSPRYPPRASRASTRSPPSRSSSVGSQPRSPPSPPAASTRAGRPPPPRMECASPRSSSLPYSAPSPRTDGTPR